MAPVKTAGYAALGAAVTYLVGFVVLLGVLIPAGYIFAPGEEADAIAFLARHIGMMTAWNSVIYIANAVLVGVLVIALYEICATLSPRLMRVASAFGLVWVGLLLAAGVVANSAIAAVALISESDPDQAIAVWRVLRIVENGLGGGNEVAGALWLGISTAAVTSLPAWLRALGAPASAAGLMTLVPPLSASMGAVFGLATLIWFLALSVFLLRGETGWAAPDLPQS